ncbi:unnamed protein product [Caenorhabditis sp. 36 PRJEB53466]|nr:unnamed protein product [Caenorhabditis sp. 36 PRJEB53466]
MNISNSSQTSGSESPELTWGELLTIIGESIVIALSVTSILATYLFNIVNTYAKRLQRVNLGSIAFTTIVLIVRNAFVKQHYRSLAHWFTYVTNWLFIFMSIIDFFSVMAGVTVVFLLIAINCPKVNKVWFVWFILACIISAIITVGTIEFAPSEESLESNHHSSTWQKIMYAIITAAVGLSAFGCWAIAKFAEDVLKLEMEKEGDKYVRLRFCFDNIKAVAHQAQWCSLGKTVLICIMIGVQQDRGSWHLFVLFGYFVSTFLSFFSHKDARIHFRKLLERCKLCRRCIKTPRDSQYEVEEGVPPEDYNDMMARTWEEAYDRKQKDQEHDRISLFSNEPLQSENRTNFLAKFLKAKAVFDNLNLLIQRNKRRTRVNPATHTNLFVVQPSPNATLTTIC